MLRRRYVRAGLTAVYLLLPLLLATLWLPLLPERAALHIAAARGQLVPAATSLEGLAFSPLWFGYLALLTQLSLPVSLLAALTSALGWGMAALLLMSHLRQRVGEWAAVLLPMLLLLSPLLPAVLGTAVPWQLTAVLLVYPTTVARSPRAQRASLLLLPLVWTDWPAWLLAGGLLWRRAQERKQTPWRELVGIGALFVGGSILRFFVRGGLWSLLALDPPVAQKIILQLAAESEFYLLALLFAMTALLLSVRCRPRFFGGGLLLGTVTALTDGELGLALLLTAVLAALATTAVWLSKRLRPRLTRLPTTHANGVLIILIALPLFLAQTGSLQQRYFARPVAYNALLAQASNWLAAAEEGEAIVLAPAALAGQIDQQLWPFTTPVSSSAWGELMSALNAAPPTYVVGNTALGWDRLQRTGWFQERYKPVQEFVDPAAVQSPVTVWEYVTTPFDQGEKMPIQVQAENGLRLTGYRYWPRAIQPGEAVHVTLNWQKIAANGRNVNTIVRIVSPTDQVGWAQRDQRTPRSLPPTWITPETVTFSERFVLTTTQEIPVGAYHLNVSLRTGRDTIFTPLFQNDDVNPIDRVLLGYVTVPWAGEIPATAMPVEAMFGNWITLRSYTLTGASRPGETMTATLYWETTQPLPADYTVFLHLLDEAGEFVAGFDGPPMNGRYPTRGWLPRSPVPDPHLMSLPSELPPGEYQLRTGLYLPENGERLTAVDASGTPAHNNAILLQTITVTP